MDYDFKIINNVLKQDSSSQTDLLGLVGSAIIENLNDVARNILDFFFNMNTANLNFICQAYLYDAKLSIPVCLYDVVSIIELSEKFMKALEFMLDGRNCQLLYSSSIDFLEVSHHFLRQDTRILLLIPLKCFYEALHENPYCDFQWKLTILKQYFLCLLHPDKKEEMIEVGLSMLDISRNISDSFLKDTQIFLESYQPDTKQFNIPNEVSFFGRFQRLLSTVSNSVSLTQSDLSNLFRQVIREDPKEKSITEISSLTALQASEFRDLFPKLKSTLIARICFTSLRSNDTLLAEDCLIQLQKVSHFHDIEEYSLLFLYKHAKNISSKLYTRNGFKKYLKYIFEISKQLRIVSRSRDVELVEIISCLIWDLALPLLQHNYSQYIKTALSQIAKALKDINSHQFILLSFVYRELALCAEYNHNINSAMSYMMLSNFFNPHEDFLSDNKYDISRLRQKKTFFINQSISIERALQLFDLLESNCDLEKNRDYLFEIGNCLLNLPFRDCLDTAYYQPHNELSVFDSDFVLDKLNNMVSNYEQALKKTHSIAFSNEDIVIRCQLWLKLAKSSRKLKFWDIARVAARFCLTHDISGDNLSMKEFFNFQHSKIQPQDPLEVKNFENWKKNNARFSNVPEVVLLKIYVDAEYILAESLVEIILKEKITLFQVPDLSKYCLKDVHKNDSKWLNFINWVSIVSQTALEGFIFVSQKASMLSQDWLVRNSLVCFWNYSKHLIHSDQIIFLLQPLIDMNKFLKKMQSQVDGLLHMKLLLFCITAFFASFKLKSKIPKSSSTSRVSNSKFEKSTPTLSGEILLTSEQLDILKESNDICDQILNIFRDFDLDLEYFYPFVNIWIKIRQNLNQLINLEKEFENLNENPGMKAIVAIEIISNSIVLPGLTIEFVINLLLNSNNLSDYLVLKLWCKLTMFCFNVADGEISNLCLTHARERGLILLDNRNNNNVKIYYFLAEVESMYARNVSHSKVLDPKMIIEQIIVALKLADKSDNIRLKIFNLQYLCNYFKICRVDTNFHTTLTHNSSDIISMFTGFSKLNQQNFIFKQNYDLRIVIFSVILDSFSSLKMWNDGLIVVEKCLNLITRDKYKYLIQYKILFKSKLNRNVSVDILSVQEELENELVLHNLWLLAAQSYSESKLIFRGYRAAINSISENCNYFHKLETTLEMISWLVTIGYHVHEIAILLEECLSNLVHNIIERICILQSSRENFQTGTDNSSKIIFENQIQKILHQFFANFELLTVNEIDHLFRIFYMIQILNRRNAHSLIFSDILATLYCIYSILKLNFNEPLISTPLQDQVIKPKVGGPKLRIEDGHNSNLFPSTLGDWLQFCPNNNKNSLHKDSFFNLLNKPNISLYYLHHLCQELKLSFFIHYIILPLSMIDSIVFSTNDLPKGWSILAQTQMLQYARKFKFESAIEFWNQRISGESIPHLDKIYLLEINEYCFKPDSDLFDSSSYDDTPENIATTDLLLFEFDQTEYIIYLVLETAEVFLEMGEWQKIIDIISECQLFIKPKKIIFEQRIQFLKIRAFSYLNIKFDKNSYFNSILSLKGMNVHLIYSICLFISKDLPQNLAIDFLEFCKKKAYEIKDKVCFLFCNIQVNLELELATLKLKSLFFEYSLESNYKRDLIDIEILLETIYGCYCILNSDQDFMGAIKVLNHYIYFLKELDIKSIKYSQNKYLLAFKTIIFLRKCINHYLEMFAYILSFDFDFGITVNGNFPLFKEYIDSILALTSYQISLFDWCTKYDFERKFSFRMSHLEEKVLEEYLLVDKGNNSNFILLNQTFCDISESISLLTSLRSICQDSRIYYQKGYLMLTLNTYFSEIYSNVWNKECIIDYISEITQLYIDLEEFNEHQINQAYSLLFLIVAKQNILQFLFYSLTNSIYLDECKKISLELVENFGLIDRRTSTQFLTLFQSCEVSIYFQSIFEGIFINPCISKLAQSKINDPNFNLCTKFPRMKVSPDFFDIDKDFPPNFRFLILEHSLTNSHLFYAYIQHIPSIQKQTKSHQQVLQPFIGRCKVNIQNLYDIVSITKSIEIGKEPDIFGKINGNDFELTSGVSLGFADLNNAILDYFNCIMNEISSIISSEANPHDLNLFLLCDHQIFSFPIELLFHNGPFSFFDVISRDFSLQFVHYRFKSLISSSDSKDSYKSKESLPQNSQDNERQYLDISNTSLFIDPFNLMNDQSFKEKDTNHELLKKAINSHGKLTHKWNGVVGKLTNNYISDNWQILKSNNLMLLLTGDFDNFYKFDALVSFARKDVNLAIIFDNILPVNSDKEKKSKNYTSFDSCNHIAAILSITGINILILNFCPQSSSKITFKVAETLNLLLRDHYKITSAVNEINGISTTVANEAKGTSLLFCPNFSFVVYGMGNFCII